MTVASYLQQKTTNMRMNTWSHGEQQGQYGYQEREGVMVRRYNPSELNAETKKL